MFFFNLLGDIEGGEVPLLVLAHQEGKLAERFGIVPAILGMMTVVFTGLAIGLILKAHHFVLEVPPGVKQSSLADVCSRVCG